MGADEQAFAQSLLDELARFGSRGALLVREDGRYMASRACAAADADTLSAMALALHGAAAGALPPDGPVRVAARSRGATLLVRGLAQGMVLTALADAASPVAPLQRALDEGADALDGFLGSADVGKASSRGSSQVEVVDAPRRILIVEDEPDIRNALKDLLETGLERVEVLMAADGQEALRMLPNARPHLIISDFKMPGMDGLAFLEASRAQMPDAPKVLMTAYPDMDVAIKAINDAHIENFFQKPLDPAQVLAKIDRILHMQEAKHDRERALAKSIDALRARLADVEKP